MSNYLSVGSSAESSADISVWHIAGLPAALMLLLFLRPCSPLWQTDTKCLIGAGRTPTPCTQTHTCSHPPLLTPELLHRQPLPHGVAAAWRPLCEWQPGSTAHQRLQQSDIKPVSLPLSPSLPPSLLLPSLQIYNRTSFSKHNPVFFLVWLSSIMEHPELCASCFSLKPIPTPADITDRHTNHYSVGLKGKESASVMYSWTENMHTYGLMSALADLDSTVHGSHKGMVGRKTKDLMLRSVGLCSYCGLTYALQLLGYFRSLLLQSLAKSCRATYGYFSATPCVCRVCT